MYFGKDKILGIHNSLFIGGLENKNQDNLDKLILITRSNKISLLGPTRYITYLFNDLIKRKILKDNNEFAQYIVVNEINNTIKNIKSDDLDKKVFQDRIDFINRLGKSIQKEIKTHDNFTNVYLEYYGVLNTPRAELGNNILKRGPSVLPFA